MAFKFHREVVKTSEGRIKFRRFNPEGRDHYRIAIWLGARDDELDSVKSVEYELHPSFAKPVRKSSDRGKSFGIKIWTWGMFSINAKIHLKAGETIHRRFYLSYDLPDDDETNYVDVTPETLRGF